MKVLISIFLILVAVWIFTSITNFYDRTAKPHSTSDPAPAPAAAASSSSDSLPGLPPQLEASLAQARSEGTDELGKWLKQFGRQVQDPRLAAIELDYVVLLNLRNHKAARERFLQVANRVQPGSPVFERIRKLAPAYEE